MPYGTKDLECYCPWQVGRGISIAFAFLSNNCTHIHSSLPTMLTEQDDHLPADTKMDPKPYPSIAILGAGPSGLVLASLLCKASIPYTMYDLRPSPTSPDSPFSTFVPSGSLDLHADSGILALEACGLIEKFWPLTGECSDFMIIADKMGHVRYQDDEAPGPPEEDDINQGRGRPEIARNALTSLLISSIPADKIKWQHKVHSVSPKYTNDSSTSSYTVSYTSSSSNVERQEAFDIVIGADGAWSRLRPLVTTTTPHYSTVNCVTITVPNITTTYPHLASFIGPGSYSATGEHKAIMSQRGSIDSARVYLMLQDQSPSYLDDIGLTDLLQHPDQLQRLLLEDEKFFSTWGEELKDLIAAGCSAAQSQPTIASIKAYPLHMLPIAHTWPHKRNITLLGDAAHLMTPFAGEGVNMAMLDALELANELIPVLQSQDDKANGGAAIERYEKKMFSRAAYVTAKTWKNLGMIMDDPNAPEGFVNFMLSPGGPPPEIEA